MKAVSFVLLALGAASVSACNSYYDCHCVQSDSSPNNKATDDICNYMINTYGLGEITQHSAPDGGDECLYGTGSSVAGWDNCLWRVYCKIVGATGQDSNCEYNIGG
jgi:hypothetical protein